MIGKIEPPPVPINGFMRIIWIAALKISNLVTFDITTKPSELNSLQILLGIIS